MGVRYTEDRLYCQYFDNKYKLVQISTVQIKTNLYAFCSSTLLLPFLGSSSTFPHKPHLQFIIYKQNNCNEIWDNKKIIRWL
ncbi:hypothetical protein BpHYR1_000836 [Brachionus plicatilis]|uniref:Uncharacterized protein n=1 Tax=Brachionus plicatilis TaxID=10195 RepID=A0A3M7PZ62_BRAPC|nr:hypothetical protein BpHYR1_000836 [Brachionus plicatilis]